MDRNSEFKHESKTEKYLDLRDWGDSIPTEFQT
jgi:hypothetical protein